MPRGRTWVRIDARIHCDPDLMAVGPWAVVAFEGLVRIAKMLGTAGHLAPKIRAPAYVSAAAWGWASDSAETHAIGDALTRLVTACDGRSDGPLVACDCASGCLRIRTWEDWQSDPTHADRQARYRARASGQLPVQSDAHGTPGDAPVTPTGRPGDMEGEGEVEVEIEKKILPRAARPAPPTPLPTLEPDPEPAAPARLPAKPRKPRKVPDSGHHAILEAYVQAHLRHRGIAPVIAGPEVRAVKAMRAAKPADVETAEAWDAELERLVDLYVASTDEWRERQGWDLRFLPAQLTKLRQEARGIDADYTESQRQWDEEVDRRVTAQQAAEAAEAALESAHTRPAVDAETRAAMRADFEALQAEEAAKAAEAEAETIRVAGGEGSSW